MLSSTGADGMDPCEFVHCGPNSQCEMMKTASSATGEDQKEARCVCLPGFSESWDEPDLCVKGKPVAAIRRRLALRDAS